MKPEQESLVAAIPMRKVGPVKLSGPEAELEALIPLATFETPLWPSVERGARVTAQAGGIRAVVCDERICEGAMYAKMLSIMGRLLNNPEQLEQPPERVLYDEGHEFHLPEPKRHRFFRKGKEESVQA